MYHMVLKLVLEWLTLFLQHTSKPHSTHSAFFFLVEILRLSFFTLKLFWSIKTSGLIKCHSKTLFKESWQSQWRGGSWGYFTASLYRVSQAQDGWFILFSLAVLEREWGVSMGIAAFSSLEALTVHMMIHLAPLAWKSSRGHPWQEMRRRCGGRELEERGYRELT